MCCTNRHTVGSGSRFHCGRQLVSLMEEHLRGGGLLGEYLCRPLLLRRVYREWVGFTPYQNPP